MKTMVDIVVFLFCCLFSRRMLLIHWLSPCLSCRTRYTARPCKKSVIHIQPPFLRPEIDRQMPAKVRDNGIQSHDLQNRVCANRSHAKVKPRTVKYFPAYHLRIVTSFVKGSDLSCFTVFFFLLPASLSRSCRAVRHQTGENSSAAATKTRPRPAEKSRVRPGRYRRLTHLYFHYQIQIQTHKIIKY